MQFYIGILIGLAVPVSIEESSFMWISAQIYNSIINFGINDCCVTSALVILSTL